MKKKFWGVALSICILLSVCSPGIEAIAQNTEPPPSPPISDTDTPGGEPTPDPPPNPDDPNPDAEEVNVSVKLNVNAIQKSIAGKDYTDTGNISNGENIELIYGQDLPDLNENDENNIPKYYSVVYSDSDDSVPEDIYGKIKLEYSFDDSYDSGDFENKLEYNISVVRTDTEEDIVIEGIKYIVDENIKNKILVNWLDFEKTESPEVSVKAKKDGMYLSVNNDNFQISLSPDKNSFNGNEVKIPESLISPNSEEEPNSYSFYLRYVNTASKYYNGIGKTNCENNSLPSITEVTIDGEEFNEWLEQNGNVFAYNKELSFIVKGKANSTDPEIKVYYEYAYENESENIEIREVELKTLSEEISPNKIEYGYVTAETLVDGDNSENDSRLSFEKKAVITLPEENTVKNFTLTFEIISNRMTSGKSFTYPDNGEFILENVSPKLTEYENANEQKSPFFIEDNSILKFLPTDDDSGLFKVEYSLDGLSWNSKKNTWEEITDPQNIVFAEYKFGSEADKGAAECVIDLSEQSINKNKSSFRKYKEGGIHELTVRLTDYANNVYETTYVMDKGYDYKAPILDSVYFMKQDSEGKWKTIPKDKLNETLKMREHGNYTNVSLRLAFKAHDAVKDNTAVSGINSELVTIGGTKAEYDSSGGYYYISVNSDINDLGKIYIEDECKNSLDYDIVSKFEGMTSSELIVDKENPNASIKVPETVHTIDGVNYFGAKEKEESLIFNVSDVQSGIAEIIIKDGDKELIHQIDEFICSRKDNLTIDSKDFGITFETLGGGSHSISISVTDNAGNTQNTQYDFECDFTAPSGRIEVKNSNKAKIITVGEENQMWFNSFDDPEIEFTINDNDPYEIEWKIIGSESSDNGSFYVGEQDDFYYSDMLNLSKTSAALKEKGEHKFTVSVILRDKANNETELPAVEIYKDTHSPTIEKISVEKTANAADQILRVLTFGIFSNDKIRVKVDARDEFDSGVNDVEVSFTGDPNEEFYHTTYDEKKKAYILDIPFDKENEDLNFENIYSGYIRVKVTDKMGKTTYSYNKINSLIASTDPIYGEGEKEVTKTPNYMVEKIDPTATFDIPTSDGVERDDGQIWYNSEKTFTIEAADKDSGLQSVSVDVNNVLKLETDINNESFLTSEYTESLDDIVKESSDYVFTTETIKTLLSNENKLPKDNHYTLTLLITDNAGNTLKEVREYNLDEVNPSVNSIDFSVTSADGYANAADFIEYMEYGYYFKEELEAHVNVSDPAPSSGLYKVEYSLVEYRDGERKSEREQIEEAVIENGVAAFTVPKDFKGQIYVQGYDKVGNASEKVTPQAFIVDTPDRHDGETHFDFEFSEQTSYRDSSGNALYTGGVSITATVTDEMSGIRSVKFWKTSEKDGENGNATTVNLTNAGYKLNQDVGEGWIVTAMDNNIVTEIKKTFSFGTDDNDIQVNCEMTDRSNNTSSGQSNPFTIDTIAPSIEVVFDEPAGVGAYYSEERTAVVKVTERNFDPSRIIADIENSYSGSTPTLSFTDDSLTEHTAVLVFREGDYTFSIEGTDRGDHTASVKNNSKNSTEFYVDKTDPRTEYNDIEFVNRDTFNQFNTSKVMKISFFEHNFDSSLTDVKVYRAPSGTTLSENNREDCTAEYILNNSWDESNAKLDEHILNIKFPENKNCIYQIVINGADKSGRKLREQISPIFEIDKVSPVLKSPENLETFVYTSDSIETKAEPIRFFDHNISKVEYTINSYQMRQNNNVGYDMKTKSFDDETEGGTVVLPDDCFTADGIYEVNCVAYDIAGNKSEMTTHTYVIQRESDFLVYIPNSNKKNKTGVYEFDQIGMRYDVFPDVNIVAYITADKKFSIEVDGNTVPDNDLLYQENDGKEINNVKKYDVIFRNSYIAANYNSDTVEADLPLNAAAEDDDAKKMITLGHIYIDNVKPTGEYEDTLKNWQWFNGYYETKKGTQNVRIVGVSPDINPMKCIVIVNGEELPVDYEESTHTLTFALSQGYNDIRPTLVDKAGNTYTLEHRQNVYVGSFFKRWWYFFVLGGILVIGIPTGLFFLIRKIRGKKVI